MTDLVVPARPLVKGHGTENDFVILPDLDGDVDLTPAFVRALCDRHGGIGADGVLRVVPTRLVPGFEADAPAAPFFMDYRNADGSLAQMCGNGVRVFVRYLLREGLVSEETVVATRGGRRRAWLNADGTIGVEMGEPEFLEVAPEVVTRDGRHYAALAALNIPNPHVVLLAADADEVAALDLTVAPQVEPALPEGQNVEFLARLGHRRLRMRVHERGVGETRSCGTGICAAVVAVARDEGVERDGAPWVVEVPGGECSVTWHPTGTITMSGPAVLVADLTLSSEWVAAHQA